MVMGISTKYFENMPKFNLIRRILMKEEFIFLTIIFLHISAIEVSRTTVSQTIQTIQSIEGNHDLTLSLGVGYDN